MFTTQESKPEDGGQKSPLSPWEKIKTGTKSFVKAVVDYVPRGILLSAAFVGSAVLMANITGWDPLAMGHGGMTWMKFLERTLAVVGLSSIINGSIGAYQGVKAESAHRSQEIELQKRALLKEKSRARNQEQEKAQQTYEEITVQHDLPYAEAKSMITPRIA